MNSVLVSIILPIFNIKESFLKKCVTSLMNQNYKNIEIILVDDGSTTDILKLCFALRKQDERITVISQKNMGVSVARNRGLAEAKGNYVCFVDPDDWVSESYIMDLVEAITDSDADFSVSNCYACYENDYLLNNFLEGESRILEGKQKNELLYQLVGKKICSYYPKYIAAGVPWCKMFKRSFLEKNKLNFVPNLKRMQDNVFSLYAIEHAQSIAYISKANYFYRKDQNSISSKYSDSIVQSFHNYFDETFKFLDKFNKEELMYHATYMKELTSFNSYFSRYFFNKENKRGFKENVQRVKDLLKEPRYRLAFNELNYEILNTQEKIFVFCLKNNFFVLLWCLVKIRN